MNKNSDYQYFLPHKIVYPLYRFLLPLRFQELQKYRHLEAGLKDRSLKGFDERKCIYIHIPKTGGVSISHALFGNLGGGHRTITSYYKVFSPLELKQYFKFTVVRNPWDRLVSAYFFLKEGGFHDNDQVWQKNNLEKFETFEDFVLKWVNHKNIYSYIHFIPQFAYINNFGKILVDKIYKIEEIKDGIADINRRLELDMTLTKRNQTHGRGENYREYYTERTKNIVEDVYKNDIQNFGYSF